MATAKVWKAPTVVEMDTPLLLYWMGILTWEKLLRYREIEVLTGRAR